MDDFEEVVELGLGEGKFDAVEVFKGGAEVDKDEVAFVAELGEEGGLVGGLLCFGGRSGEGLEGGDGGSGDAGLFRGRDETPCGPVKAEELVEHGCAFEREGDLRNLRHG